MPLKFVLSQKGNIVGEIPKHEHAGNAALVKTKIIKSQVVKKAKGNDSKPATIVSKVLRGISSPVTALLPKPISLVRTVHRVRVKENPQLSNPLSRGELELPNQFKCTHNGESFLLHDSGGSKRRFLVFTTLKNLNFLSKCDQWLSDVPLVYLLSPDKTKSTYIKFLKVLRQSLPNFSPKRIVVDFEEAFIEAFKGIYSGVKISGCSFHFNQCIWRHIQLSGLQKLYNTDVTFAYNIRLLMALPFLPTDDVICGYELIVGSDYYDRYNYELNTLLEYFEITWIGKSRHNRRKRDKPRFNIKMWNCYKAVCNDYIRSNNLMEEWHNGFNRRVAVCHASIGQFLNAIKDEPCKTEMLIAQIDSGLNVSISRRKAYRDYDNRLKSIVINYNSDYKLEYLKNIAKVLSI
ncbi:uncharacterized protein [Chelonus insularis]|uniref:uncharacterized protein n=1 Tax=Chelonus insularis TaxID=460826 RepID=UPI001588FF3F|nr:uncharacterized protein LOC118071387 [Chelonus insularis]